MKNLVIVESPAKAKTIAKFLGGEYQIKSSYGHVRDLPKKEMGIDITGNFEPAYVVPPDKTKVIAELKRAVRSAETVWLATDEDREGEAIAWHLSEALGLKATATRRIAFHEITKEAVTNAVKNPRSLNNALVDAQQARRVLDRLVGYELSPLLWKKIQTGLSAGRVQSVAVKLIVERERMIRAFKPEGAFKVSATFKADGAEFMAALKDKLPDLTAAEAWLNNARQASFSVAGVTKKPATRKPAAPFTTSSLQQEAASRLGFSVKQTMTLAQRLYEAGHITYMRTDGTNLAAGALAQAAQLITKEFGRDYHQERQYQTKVKRAQEAHEAIRPTDLGQAAAGSDERQKKLYDLIRRRTLASQMAPAQLERTQALIGLDTAPTQLEAKGLVVKFEGFAKAYPWGIPKAKRLPPLQEGESVELIELVAAEQFSKPKGRYTEASLVRQLEELGIGRPSTYAPTISTIQSRGYVVKDDIEGKERTVRQLRLVEGKITQSQETELAGAESKKLAPTQVAEVVTDFLDKYFSHIVDYDFTAEVEAGFDEIAAGKKGWRDMIGEFYQSFHHKVVAAEKISRQDAAGAHKLGRDPASGRPVFARIGRYGPMLQIGEAEDEEKPRFASLPPGVRIDEIQLEEALRYFELPREVGKTKDGEVITANFGRYGPYVKVGELFVSIKPQSPLTITEAKARELIAAKRKQESEKLIQDFGTLKVLNGRYGPYVTNGKQNASVPKGQDPAQLSKAEAQAILKKKRARGGKNSK